MPARVPPPPPSSRHPESPSGYPESGSRPPVQCVPSRSKAVRSPPRNRRRAQAGSAVKPRRHKPGAAPCPLPKCPDRGARWTQRFQARGKASPDPRSLWIRASAGFSTAVPLLSSCVQTCPSLLGCGKGGVFLKEKPPPRTSDFLSASSVLEVQANTGASANTTWYRAPPLPRRSQPSPARRHRQPREPLDPDCAVRRRPRARWQSSSAFRDRPTGTLSCAKHRSAHRAGPASS